MVTVAEDLDRKMRKVLAQLLLTSNGSTATMDADRGGGSARHYDDVVLAGTLRPGDAPHAHYQRLYNEARTRAEREVVLDAARARLKSIRYSSGQATAAQTREELYLWIVANCEGLTQREAAIRACTGVTTVHKARVEHGREPERGREPDLITYSSARERRLRVRELADEDMSAKAIATFLGLSLSTVRRDLGRKR